MCILSISNRVAQLQIYTMKRKNKLIYFKIINIYSKKKGMIALLIKPLNDYVVLKYKKVENIDKSGIILGLDNNKKEESIGIVLNFGPKIKELKENDEVVYKNYSGTKFKIKDEEYLIIKYEDILAILEK